jgi:predicted permease
MGVLLPALVPVSLILLIGFIAEKTLPLERQTLAQLVLYILAPALVADSLYRTTLSVESTTRLVLGFAIASTLLFIFIFVLAKLLKLPNLVQKSLIATTLFPNSGNLGLPLNAFAFGDPGLERAVVYMITASLLMFGVGPALLKGGGIKYGIRLTLTLPLFWAMVGGLGLRALPFELPLRLDEGIAMLGRASIPVSLIILGMQLAKTEFKLGWYEAFASGLRLIIAPGIAYGVGIGLGLTGLDLQVLVLQSAMPTAVNAFVLSTEFGGDAPRVARTIVVSTLFSFGTLPVILWLMELLPG